MHRELCLLNVLRSHVNKFQTVVTFKTSKKKIILTFLADVTISARPIIYACIAIYCLLWLKLLVCDLVYIIIYWRCAGHAMGQLVEALRYNPEGRGFDSRIFHWHNHSDHNTGVDSASNSTRNVFLRVKTAGSWGWQPYYLHVPIVLKSGSLRFLEPSGPVQACIDIALHLSTVCKQSSVQNCLFTSLLFLVFVYIQFRVVKMENASLN